MNGEGDLFVCDLLSEYFSGTKFLFQLSFNDIDDGDLYDTGMESLEGDMTYAFANQVYDAIKDRNVRSFHFCSNMDLSDFMLDVVIPLWKNRFVSFEVIDLDSGYHRTQNWNTSNTSPSIHCMKKWICSSLQMSKYVSNMIFTRG